MVKKKQQQVIKDLNEMINLDKLYSAPVGFSRIGMNNVIKEFVKFKYRMDEINEQFFLLGGTELGIVRDGCLIEHDRDLDIGIMSEESLYRIREKLSKYYDEIIMADYNKGIIERNGKRLWFKKHFGKWILPIEVQVHYIKDNYIYFNRHLGETFKRGWKKGRCVWPKRLFNKFEKINFAGESFNIPSPVEEHIKTFYGIDWKTPEVYKDWRYHCHNLYEGWW